MFRKHERWSPGRCGGGVGRGRGGEPDIKMDPIYWTIGRGGKIWVRKVRNPRKLTVEIKQTNLPNMVPITYSNA
jgi:hypothetical protein